MAVSKRVNLAAMDVGPIAEFIVQGGVGWSPKGDWRHPLACGACKLGDVGCEAQRLGRFRRQLK